MQPEEILSTWNDFIEEYEDNLVSVRQRVSDIVNDPQSTQTEKDNAQNDLSMQESYLAKMKEKKQELLVLYVEGQPLPEDVTIDGYTSGSGLYKWLDSTSNLKIGTAIEPPPTFDFRYESKMRLIHAEDFDLYLYATDFGATFIYTPYYPGTPSGNTYNIGIAWTYQSAGATAYMHRRVDFTTGDQPIETTTSMNYTASDSLVGIDGAIPVLTMQSFQQQYPIILGNLLDVEVDSTTFDTAQPWDGYNSEIYPNLNNDDNAAFPGGYIPPSPDNPPDEPDNLPHDDGTPPSLQEERRISVPSMFITQYALNASELIEFGTNLWTSWLTPNTDVWKNFYISYGQDFGTFNIGSCMEFITSLKIFPFEFPLDWLVPKNGLRIGTGHTNFVSGTVPGLNSQIYSLDLGECEVTLPNPYNDFRDIYNCSAICFMPYCGSVELNLAEIIGRKLKAVYFIDVQSGGCTCVIKCEGDAGDYVIASKTGQIGFSLPLTATNAGQLTAQLMSDSTKAIGTIAGTFFSNMNKARDLAMNIAGVNQAAQNGMDFDYAQSKAEYYQQKANLGMAEGTLHGALGLVNQGIDMLSRSGIDMPMLSGGGSAESFMFPDCVSLQIRRGKYAKPTNYPHSQAHINASSGKIKEYRGKFRGNPDTGSATDKGLCKFTGVDTSGLTCHEDERAEILSILENGIYI